MFHSLSIKIEIKDLREYQDIPLMLPMIKTEHTKKGSVSITRELSNEGFDEVCLTTFRQNAKGKRIGFIKHYLTIRINLPTLLFGKDDLRVVSYNELHENDFEEHINKLIRKRLNLGYTFDQFNLDRVDYAVDHKMKNEKRIDAIIAVSNKSRGLNFGRYRKSCMSGSYYLRSDSKDESVRVNWYNKKDKVKKDIAIGKSYSPESIADIENIFRMEIQCYTPKIYHLRNKLGLDKRNPLEYLTPEVSLYVLRYYIEKIYGTENFYSLKRAEQKIQDAESITDSMKKKMVATLVLISKHRDMNKAKATFIGEGTTALGINEDKPFKGSRNIFDGYIRRIRELGINPVTIPDRFRIDFIPNPIRRIDKLEEKYDVDMD